MNKHKLFKSCLWHALLVAGLAVLASCETKVDLLAPYKSTPVIVGVLDYTNDTQFVRINRTFLGEGNANSFAQIRDSVEYDPSEVEAWLVKNQNGNPIDSIQLSYFEKPSRDPGAFFNENVGFWITDQPLFTEAEIEEIELAPLLGDPTLYTYTCNVTARGVRYSATTDFPSLNANSIVTPFSTEPPAKVEFYNATSGTFPVYPMTFKYNKFAVRYQGELRLHYEYQHTDGSIVPGLVHTFNLGTRVNTEQINDNINNREFNINPEAWYMAINEEFSSLSDLQKIRIKHLEFRLLAGNEIINRYISVAQPISDFTPVLSTYTNWNKGAIGILGATTKRSVITYLEEEGMLIMNQGDFAVADCYCNIDWPGSNYVCTPSASNCP